MRRIPMSRGSGIRFPIKMGTSTQSAQYYVWSQPPEENVVSGVLNQNSSFSEANGEDWEEETTGDDSASIDFSTIGFALLASTLLSGVRLGQSILTTGRTYRVEIEVSNYASGTLFLFNDDEEIDIQITASGTYIIEFVAKSAQCLIGFKLGLVQALTCSAFRIFRIK